MWPGQTSGTTKKLRGPGFRLSGWATVPADSAAGSNVVPPLLAHFGGRTDFDVAVTWTLLNMGAGNLALQNRGFARLGEADARRMATLNQVRRDIISSRADVLAAGQQIEIGARSRVPRKPASVKTPTAAARTWAGPLRF